MNQPFRIVSIGSVRSPLTELAQAPRQGREGSPDAWLALEPPSRAAARALRPGEHVLVLTWLDRAARSVLEVHPPNVHRVRILEVVDDMRLHVNELEALDSTPIMDLKPVLHPAER
jgi:tRNA (Thr-GGU) A37 N-methylase